MPCFFAARREPRRRIHEQLLLAAMPNWLLRLESVQHDSVGCCSKRECERLRSGIRSNGSALNLTALDRIRQNELHRDWLDASTRRYGLRSVLDDRRRAVLDEAGQLRRAADGAARGLKGNVSQHRDVRPASVQPL